MPKAISLAAYRRANSVEAFPVFVRPPNLPRTCTDLALCEAVKLSLMGAPDESVAEMLGVRVKALPFWTESVEWLELVGVLQPEITAQIGQKLTRMTSIVVAQLEERVKQGDAIYRNGRLVGYKPLNASTLATLMGALLEHKAKIDRQIAGKDEAGEPAEELGELMSMMKRYASAKEVKHAPEKAPADSTIDVPVVQESTG